MEEVRTHCQNVATMKIETSEVQVERIRHQRCVAALLAELHDVQGWARFEKCETDFAISRLIW